MEGRSAQTVTVEDRWGKNGVDQCVVCTCGSWMGSVPLDAVPFGCFEVSFPLRWSQRSLGGGVVDGEM